MAAILANANDKPTMAAATSIYDPKHRKALEDFTQRLLTQVHHRYDIPYEYLLRDIYDTMVWSAPAPPSATPRSKKITCDATPVKPKTMKPKTPTQTNATPEEESKKAINKESKKKATKTSRKTVRRARRPTLRVPSKRKRSCGIWNSWWWTMVNRSGWMPEQACSTRIRTRQRSWPSLLCIPR